jgi:hypothetical protein
MSKRKSSTATDSSTDVCNIAVPAATQRKIGRPLKTGWEERFLVLYRECGSQRTAAKAAGVSHTLIAKRAKASPEFDEQLSEAREGHLDDLEAELTDMARKRGNVIAAFARLRADRPHRYWTSSRSRRPSPWRTRSTRQRRTNSEAEPAHEPLRWGRRGHPGRPRVAAPLKERARTYSRAYRDRQRQRLTRSEVPAHAL